MGERKWSRGRLEITQIAQIRNFGGGIPRVLILRMTKQCRTPASRVEQSLQAALSREKAVQEQLLYR